MYCKITSKKLPPKLFDKLIKIYDKFATYSFESENNDAIIQAFREQSLFGCYFDNSEFTIDHNEIVVKFTSSKINGFKDKDAFTDASDIEKFYAYSSVNELDYDTNLNNLIRLISYALYNKKIDYKNIINRLKTFGQLANETTFSSITQLAHDDKCISCHKLYPVTKCNRDFNMLESLYCSKCYTSYAYHEKSQYAIHFGNYIESLMYIAETLKTEFDELVQSVIKPIPSKIVIDDIILRLQ